MGRSSSRIRIAVVGLGHFAQAAVLPAIEQLADVEVVALVSGSRHKLDELGQRHSVRALCGYDGLAEVIAMKLAGRDPRFAAVDEAFAVTLRFPQDRVAQFSCSFGAHDRANYQVVGTDGFLTLDNAYEYAAEMTLHVQGKHGDKTRTF